VEEQVARVNERIRAEQGRVDILVNDVSEGEKHEWKPFWKLDLEKGFRMLRNALHSHIITSRYVAVLMIEHGGGLIVEIGDGDILDYRATLFYDLIKFSVTRFAFAMAEELHKDRVAVVAITPEFMRTEAMLDHFGVTEANWREGAKKDPNFLYSDAILRRPSNRGARDGSRDLRKIG
jgi:NAD(P)-dependent dehydrogenase (short-subunit alcohol dehydrogenase family)